MGNQGHKQHKQRSRGNSITIMALALPRLCKYSLTFILTFVLTLMMVVGINSTTRPALAQFSFPEDFGKIENIKPPSAVTRYGNLETIKVSSPLSSRTLFVIASPTIYDRTPEVVGDRQTVERRAEEIQAKLLLLLNRPMDPETLIFEVSQLNNVTIIDVRDAQYPRSLVLLSVTDLDADFNGLPIEQLAMKWRTILEQELREGLEKLPTDRQRVNQILLGLLFLTIGLLGLKYGLWQRQQQLQGQKKVISATAQLEPITTPLENPVSSHELAQKRTIFLQKFRQLFSLDRQLTALDFIQWLLFWLLILAWYGGFTWVILVSPYLITKQFKFLDILLSMLMTWFLTGLAIRFSRYLIDRFTGSWKNFELVDFLDLGDAHRHQLRTSTIAGAAKGLATIVIAILGLLSALETLGLPTVSVVAIGSFLGLAITFGSQNLVKDLVNGFFILAEDQYAIGDVIDVGEATGLVENLNMRVTQIRSSNGELVTIPNSSISQVKNLTRSWSRVDFSIDVAYQTDPDQALALFKEIAQELYQDPAWHAQIMAEPNVLGIDSVSHSGMTITTWIQTEPAQQWAVGREFRLRVRRALTSNNIEIGTPRQTLAIDSPPGNPKDIPKAPLDQEI